MRTHIRIGEHLEAIAEYLASDYVDRLVHHFRQLPKRTLDDAHLNHLGTTLQHVLRLVTDELETFHRTGREDVTLQHKVVTAAVLGNIPPEMLDASPVETALYFLFVLPPSLGSEYAIYTALLLDTVVGEKARQDFTADLRLCADDLVAWFDFVFYTYGLLAPDPADRTN